MILSNENYFSREATEHYLGASQFKDFAGSLGKQGCEAAALAKIRGTWVEEPSTAMLVGSYVDSHFEGTLNLFKAQNPSLFTKSGDLKAEFRKAEEIINMLEQDEFFMAYMAGQKQVIMTGEIEGQPFKIKIDSYLEGRAITDLKIMASITKREWVKDFGKMNFIEYWGYDIQGAIYQEIVRQNTSQTLPFFIAAGTKEKVPNKEVIWIDDNRLSEALGYVKMNLPRIAAIKKGETDPTRCGHCDYCRATKRLTKAIHFSEIEEDI